MSKTTSVIYDQDSNHFIYGGNTWTTLSHPGFFGGSIAQGTDQQSSLVTVAFSGMNLARRFYVGILIEATGTAIAVYGSISAESGSHSQVTVDTGGMLALNNTGNISKIIYQSPQLSDDTHNITISGFSYMGLDFAVVTAGKNTPLSGEQLIVDEADPSVVFSGEWTKNTSNLMDPAFETSRYPYQGAIHQATLPGASATFSFNGTSVSVFGVNLAPASGLGINYTLDGQTTQEIYSDSSASADTYTNYQWFTRGNLAPTMHTLEIAIDSNSGGIFSLDYILYTASKPSGPITTLPTSGFSHRALIGVIVGPLIFAILFVVVVVLLYRKRYLSRRLEKVQTSTVTPFQGRPPAETLMSTHHKTILLDPRSHRNSPSYGEIPELNSTPTATASSVIFQKISTWQLGLMKLLRRGTESSTSNINTFPTSWASSNHPPNHPLAQRKPVLSELAVQGSQRRRSQDSTTQTIIVDPRVQELEEMVISLQQEIEDSRQVRFGNENGILMREMVETSGQSSTRVIGRIEDWEHGSIAMSSTVV